MSLQQMREMDIRTVDLDSLVEGSAVFVDMDLPKEERMLGVVNQMSGNPYFMRSGEIAVKISHADTAITVDQRTEDWLRTQ